MEGGANVLFVLWGAVLVFSMHAGFAFLEAGSVRKKNVVNAFTKILTDWSASVTAYFLIGFPIAYGITFFRPAAELMQSNGIDLSRFFLLAAFAAVIPAVISGGMAERAKFAPQVIAGGILTGLIYPIYEGLVWGRFGLLGADDGLVAQLFGVGFHDYAGSVVVHAMAGWLALPAIFLLGPRLGRFVGGESRPLALHNVPFIALGTWFLMIGWFGFNVVSAGEVGAISGLVAANSLLALAGGALAGLAFSRGDSVFVHNGALAGLVAICAGSDLVHPLGALLIGLTAGGLFVRSFLWANEHWKLDDFMGVWPLHGIAGAWGGVAVGIFGLPALGGLGGVSLASQVVGTGAAIGIALVGGYLVFRMLDATLGLRLEEHEEIRGSDLVVHNGKAYPEELI